MADEKKVVVGKAEGIVSLVLVVAASYSVYYPCKSYWYIVRTLGV